MKGYILAYMLIFHKFYGKIGGYKHNKWILTRVISMVWFVWLVLAASEQRITGGGMGVWACLSAQAARRPSHTLWTWEPGGTRSLSKVKVNRAQELESLALFGRQSSDPGFVNGPTLPSKSCSRQSPQDSQGPFKHHSGGPDTHTEDWNIKIHLLNPVLT